MKFSKKVICLFLSVLFICSAFFSISVSAATYREYGGFRFKYLNDGTAMIADYLGESSTMVIPDTLLDHPVSSIEPNAFYEDDYVEHIVFGNNFSTVSAFAFANSTALKDLTFPDSLKEIVFCAFNGCSALTFVDFANCQVSTVSEQCFSECALLSDVILSSNVTTIESRAFERDPSLKRIYIPSSVNNIAGNVFYNSPNVTVYCYSDSYALQYAVENNLNYFIIDSVDKSELESSINSADEILNDFDIYIPETVVNFQNIYDQALTVYNDVFANQQSVAAANETLLNAINIAEKYKLGDVDLDKLLSIKDAALIQLYLAQLTDFTDTQLKLCDVEQDGEPNIKDAARLQLIIAELA